MSVVPFLLITAGCLGFEEKEITQDKLPTGYPVSYKFSIKLIDEKAVFNLTNTGNTTLLKVMAKFEVSKEGQFSFSSVSLGDLMPGGTKQSELDAKYLTPTRILIWHEDLKSWVIVWPITPQNISSTITPSSTPELKRDLPSTGWNRTFGGARNDTVFSVQQISDGGYILAGETRSYGAGDYDFWLIKTDANGKELWNMTFGGTGDDGAMSIHQTSDGGYIIAGKTASYGAGGL